MPKYNSITTFVADNSPTFSLPHTSNRTAWRRLFCLFLKERSAENFACWAAIHQYKKNQRKRFAVFIDENWLSKPPSAAVSIFAPSTFSLFETINISRELGVTPQARMQVSWMKMVMTKEDKSEYSKEQIKFLGYTPPDLFDVQYVEIGKLLTGMMYNRFDSDVDVMPGGNYPNLTGELASMQAAGFDLHRYGMW